MTRFIPYILYLYLIACFRTLLVEPLSIGNIQLYLTPLIVMLVALHKDHITALWFGFAAGIVYDAVDPAHMGVQIVILSAIGIITAQAKDRFNLESLKSLILLLSVGLIAFAIPHTLIYTTSGVSEFGRLFLQVTLPGVVYTAFIGWLFFMIKTGRISYKKFKELF
ncbi:MAG: rod shape-determining protein MreD [Candidatus Zixiibacteriota bacterium]